MKIVSKSKIVNAAVFFLFAANAHAGQSPAEIQAFLMSLKMQSVWEVDDQASIDDIDKQFAKLNRTTESPDEDEEDDGC